MQRLCLSTLILMVGLSPVAFAATIHVPADYSTIQAAIDAADTMDTIIIETAIYNENIFIWKPLVVLGNDNPTIDGGGFMATVTFVGNEGPEARLEGFTIQNGSDIYGGGIAGNGTLASIVDCVITANDADVGGGMFRCNGLIDNCQITLNTATYGGGLYRCDGAIIGCVVDGNTAIGSNNDGGDGGGLYDCQASISFSEITNNLAEGPTQFYLGYGGGLYGCHGPITDCDISGNTARSGAGLYYCGGTITSCTISGNTATYHGSGLSYCDGSILHCYIQGNTASYAGGGLYNCDGGLIENCVISGNTSGSWSGGGLKSCSSVVNNCTIVGNSASNGGGLADCGVITNSIVWFNKPLGPSFQQIVGGTVSYCDVQDGDDCTGCIITHPLFVDSGSWNGDTWIEGDYHLREVSSCIDAGDPAFTSEGTDWDGDPRVLNDRVDMGVDEFDPSPGGDLPDFDGDGIPDVNDPDIDDDGVPNETDVCDFTPLGATVQSNGTLRGDCDGDCDVDLADFVILQEDYTGPGI